MSATTGTGGATTASPISSMAASDLASSDLDDDDQTLMAAPVNWSQDTVKALHRVVYEETMRTMVKHQFLPHSEIPAGATTVPLHLISPQNLDAPLPPGAKAPSPDLSFKTLTIDEGQFARVYELWIEGAATDQQVKEVREAKNPESTSIGAMIRIAAQYHALAHDYVTFQGAPIYSSGDPFFTQFVAFRQGQQSADGGLLGFQLTPATNPPYTLYSGTGSVANPYVYTNAPVLVPPMSTAIPGVVWGDNMLTAVTSLLATITGAGNPGPFALILQTTPYADMSAPAGSESLAITLDRIAPLFKAGVFSSSALPSTTFIAAAPGAPAGSGTPAYYTGVVVSVGGGAVSSGVGILAKLRHMQRDPKGWHRFRLMGRHVLLVSDVRAVGQLVVQGPPV